MYSFFCEMADSSESIPFMLSSFSWSYLSKFMPRDLYSFETTTSSFNSLYSIDIIIKLSLKYSIYQTTPFPPNPPNPHLIVTFHQMGIIQLQMSRVRKIYNLRKTSNLRQQSAAPEQSRVSEFREQPEPAVKVTEAFDRNASLLSQTAKEPARIVQQSQHYLVEGEELVIDKLQLNFRVSLSDVDKQEVKIKNIGNSAVYITFDFKNHPKINSHGFKDTKTKFYCHYQNTVIKPGQEATFIFSFLSEFPGNFTEEVEIISKPPLRTKIPNLKLNGTAVIQDQWKSNRHQFSQSIDDMSLRNQVRELLADIVSSVKLPPPPSPDVKDVKVAQHEFQSRNADQNLFFNKYLHRWFDELFNEICEKAGILESERYWDQSVASLKSLITDADFIDEVQKKCYLDRLEHYCYLSMVPLPNKSDLYQTIYEFVSSASYALGGEYVDSARKDLDMWEIPFREPLETDTPEDLKARKEEVDKIKAEWVKKAKKKKWGEEEQRQMMNEFKKKAQALTTENLLNRFTNFEAKAEFIKARQFLKKSDFNLQDYGRYLERIKTVRQQPLDGKKVMIKWHLKLKDNCSEKMKELEEYLAKKKEAEKKLEEQKREGAKKKKAVAKPKKKGQKEEDEEKPLFFDFMSILDEQNWNGFVETFRVVMQKQPFLVLIGITYGPRAGRHLNEYSVHFLLEHLKTLESAIDFFPHEQLSTLGQKIENQTIGEGSILLMENLNFLPYEVCQQETVIPAAEEGQPETIQRRRLLHPEIRQFFDLLSPSIDVLVNEDRYSTQLSGFTAYLNRQVLMGTLWWRYVGLSMRVTSSTVIYGQEFTPDCYLLLSRLIAVVKEIYLTGKLGLKFYLATANKQRLGNVSLTQSQKQAIQNLIQFAENNHFADKLKIPTDFVLSKQLEEQLQTIVYDGAQEAGEGYDVVDIGPQTVQQITSISKGHVFLLGQTAIAASEQAISASLSKLVKDFFKKEQAKRERHAQQASTPTGIDYAEDIVIYLVGLSEALIEKAELKQKKVSVGQEQQGGEQQQEEGEGDKKKVELVSDFRLGWVEGLCRLWRGRFDLGLRDISKYPVIIEE